MGETISCWARVPTIARALAAKCAKGIAKCAKKSFTDLGASPKREGATLKAAPFFSLYSEYQVGGGKVDIFRGLFLGWNQWDAEKRAFMGA